MDEDSIASLLFDSLPPPSSPPHTTPSPSLSPQSVFLATPSPPNGASLSPHSFPQEVPPSPLPTYDGNYGGKRRRQDEPHSQTPSPTSEWKPYSLGAPCYQVHDLVTLVPISELLDVTIIKSGANFSYSAQEDTWTCYRQNQFKLVILFQSPQALDSMCVNDGTGLTHQIACICARLYAVSETEGVVRDAMRVGLHHTGKGRRKSNKQELETVPFERGKIELNNLQFDKSNRKRECYRLILTVSARCQNAIDYPIFSKISPKVIVRGQNPGFYEDGASQTQNPEPIPSTPCILPATTDVKNVNSNLICNTTEPQTPATLNPDDFVDAVMNYDVIETDQFTKPETTIKIEDSSIFSHFGKMGINTEDPKEALSVHGNIMMTGYLYKPSDMRIKSEIVAVDQQTQLRRVRELKIYDYSVHAGKERGVLAQELATIIPEAVHTIGDTKMGSTTIPDFLVVNERTLLYENLGATQALDAELSSEKENIVNIDAKVTNLAEETTEHKEHSDNYIKSVLDVFFMEEKNGKYTYQGLEEEYVSFSFSIFRMGPARSLLMLGNIAIWAWAIGSIYLFSNIRDRRILGLSCFINFASLTILSEFYRAGKIGYSTIWIHECVNYAVGITMLIVNYIRVRRSVKQEELQKRRELIKALNLPTQSLDCAANAGIEDISRGGLFIEKLFKRKGM